MTWPDVAGCRLVSLGSITTPTRTRFSLGFQRSRFRHRLKADLTALCSFPHAPDAIWKFLFHPTTLCLVFVVAICGLLAILQLIANIVGLVTK